MKGREEQFGEMIRHLDVLLTGVSISKSKLTFQSQAEEVRKLCDWDHVEYYLSDGGYSRIWIDPFDEDVRLTSNSSEKVLARLGDPAVTALVKELVAIFAEEKDRENDDEATQ